MDLFKAIEKRHSYRGEFQLIPVPEKHLRRIVQTEIAAPFGNNSQTTFFCIVTDKSLMKGLGLIDILNKRVSIR